MEPIQERFVWFAEHPVQLGVSGSEFAGHLSSHEQTSRRGSPTTGELRGSSVLGALAATVAWVHLTAVNV